MNRGKGGFLSFRAATLFDLVHYGSGQPSDLLHKLRTGHGSLEDLIELVFPLTGQLGRGEHVNLAGFEQGQQLNGLARGNQVALFAHHIFLVDQFLDDGSPCGRGSQTALLHRLSQFLILDQFT